MKKNDIVERLRELDLALAKAQKHDWLYDRDGELVVGFHCGRIANKAADEIERLRSDSNGAGKTREWSDLPPVTSDAERHSDPRYAAVERWVYRVLSHPETCPGSIPVASAIVHNIDALATPRGSHAEGSDEARMREAFRQIQKSARRFALRPEMIAAVGEGDR